MKMRVRMAKGFALVVAASAALVVAAPNAVASHNSNGFAELVGTADPDATGKAIINYSEGGGDFTAAISAANLVPGATYSYLVWRTPIDGSTALLCTGEANSQGLFTCQAQHFLLGGYRQAVVRDAAGVVVAVGTFERRGTCRDADQSMTQCEAPGRINP
jgi:hypothetical protein